MKIRALSSDLNEDALEEVARLRITVFRDWPYLLDGDLEFERKLLHTYRKSEQAVIAGAYAVSYTHLTLPTNREV